MSSQSEHEVQKIVSYITGGDPHLEQLRSALSLPLLDRLGLESDHDIWKSPQGQTLFACAIRVKNTTALELLMQNLSLESLPKEDLLHIAVENYDEQMWRFLLQRIDLKHVFERLGTNQTMILHAAANRNIADVFRDLHERMGSDLERKLLETLNGRKETVLHVAASTSTIGDESSQRCYDTVVELLKIQRRLIREQNENGETVFHKAVAANQKRVLQYLLTVDATVLSKCDKKKESAYGLFLRRRDIVQSRKDQDIHPKLPRVNSFDEEIGSILLKAILELDVKISTMRQLLFKDEQGGFGPELIWDLSIFDGPRMNFVAYLGVLKSNRFNIKFHETLKRVTLPNLSCSENRSCDATNHGLRKSYEAWVVFDYLRSKGVKHIIEVVVPDCMVHPHANKYIIAALRPFDVRRLKWRKLNLGVRTIAMAAPEVEQLTLYSSGDIDALYQWADTDGLCRLPKLHTIHITIFKGQDNDLELEEIRDQCKEALLGHKYHSQHGCTWSLEHYDSLRKIAQVPCDCQKPRFTHEQIEIKLEPVPVSTQKPDEQLQLHQDHLQQGTIFDRLLNLQRFMKSLYTIPAGEYDDIDHLKKHAVKVAVLDSGLHADSGLFPALTGASFIEDTTTTDIHWHTASNPHGLIVATLIRKFDPNCHILAARTHYGPDKKGGDVRATIKVGSTLNAVLKVTLELMIEDTKALDWAMSHRADIICISWTCAEDEDEQIVMKFSQKIQEAAKYSLIFCATGDKGLTSEKSYPAGFPTPFKISSCSIDGQPSTQAEKKNTEFYLPTEGLDVVPPEYLNMEEMLPANGSSAATALAAGLATLILTLARFASYGPEGEPSEPEAIDSDAEVRSAYSEPFSSRTLPFPAQQAEKQVEQLKQRPMMEKVFRYMCRGSENFVQPWKVLPLNLLDRELGDAKKIVLDFLESASKNWN